MGPIVLSLSPNTEIDDILETWKIIFQPWNWRQGVCVRKIESWIKRYFNVNSACTFISGRAAMYALLHSFKIGQGDEVLIQAFTCVVVPNSILFTGAKPVFVDIDASLNIDPYDAEKKITKRTKAIILQHTFGIPAKIERLKEIARKHHILIIEDCAHSLGSRYNGKKIGTFGDAAFFSFGRDKSISSVFGGAATISDTHPEAAARLQSIASEAPDVPIFWILQQLMHPVACSIIRPIYHMWIGKLFLVGLQKAHIVSRAVTNNEKQCNKPMPFIAKYPNALARLLVHQIDKLERFTLMRKTAAKQYYDALSTNTRIRQLPFINGASYLRYPIFVETPQVWMQQTRNNAVYVGNWYHNVIDPKGSDIRKAGYQQGSCPNAEKASATILNLPTRICSDQVHCILRLLQKII